MIRIFSKKQRGAVFIEMAIAVPLLLIFFFAFYDCIMIFRAKNAMGNITRIGTLWLNSRIPIANDDDSITETSPDGNTDTFYNSKTATKSKINDLVNKYGLSCDDPVFTWDKKDTNLLFGTVEITCTVKNLTVSTLLTTAPDGLKLTMKGMGYYGDCDQDINNCKKAASSATSIP